MAFYRCKNIEPPTPPEPDYLYKWDFTKSLVDEINGEEFELFLGASRDSNGINFTGNNQGALWAPCVDLRGKTLEVEMGQVDFKGTISYTDIAFISTPQKTSAYPASTGGKMTSPLYWKGNTGWGLYGSKDGYSTQSSCAYSLYTNTGNLQGKTKEVFDFFSNKTIKIKFNNNGSQTDIWVDGVLEGTVNGRWCLGDYSGFRQFSFGNPSIKGSQGCSSGFTEARFYDMTIKELRIYENEEE